MIFTFHPRHKYTVPERFFSGAFFCPKTRMAIFLGRKKNMYNSYCIVIFAGINTNSGSFEYPGRELVRRLKSANTDCSVNVLTIYPYDDSISGDTFSDTFQVVKNAYDLRGSTVSKMADAIMNNYSSEECIFFIGYSGGGIAATKTAEKLMRLEFPKISKIIRVGSPVLTVGKLLYGRTIDIILQGDPVSQLEIPRLFKNLRPYQCYLKGLKVNRHVHSCYFREDLKDSSGISNLTKTADKILSFIKN